MGSTKTREENATAKFLEAPSEESFAELFLIYSPQLTAFYCSRGCERALAEDLTQEVMLIVYRKASQIRDRTLFHAWMFKIARNMLSRHYSKRTREVETVDLSGVPERLTATEPKFAGTPAFEFRHWISSLDSQEKEALTLRFMEDWEYHEIAAARSIPIGTVQWRVFNAKKKLAPQLKRVEVSSLRKAA